MNEPTQKYIALRHWYWRAVEAVVDFGCKQHVHTVYLYHLTCAVLHLTTPSKLMGC